MVRFEIRGGTGPISAAEKGVRSEVSLGQESLPQRCEDFRGMKI